MHTYGNSVDDHERVRIPRGMQLTEEQHLQMNHHFTMTVNELQQEVDQINYYTAVKDFLIAMRRENDGDLAHVPLE